MSTSIRPDTLLEALRKSNPKLATEYQARADDFRKIRCKGHPLPSQAQEEKETQEMFDVLDMIFDRFKGACGTIRDDRANSDGSEVVPHEDEDWRHCWTAAPFEHSSNFGPASKPICPDDDVGPCNDSLFGTHNSSPPRTTATHNPGDNAASISRATSSHEVRYGSRNLPITQVTIAHDVREKRWQRQSADARSWMETELDVVLQPLCDQYDSESEHQQSTCDQRPTGGEGASNSSQHWAEEAVEI